MLTALYHSDLTKHSRISVGRSGHVEHWPARRVAAHTCAVFGPFWQCPNDQHGTSAAPMPGPPFLLDRS